MSDLPKTIGSFSDVVAWFNHHTELINGLNQRIRGTQNEVSGLPWRVEELRSRLDLLVFRWIEADLVGVLLEEGDPDDGFSMRWSDFISHLVQEANGWNLYVLDDRKLAENLLHRPEEPQGAIFTERRGGGFRALTDATPSEG